MYEFIANLINYTGTQYNNADSYILNGCIVSLLIVFTLSVDFIYKIFLRFLPKDIK